MICWRIVSYAFEKTEGKFSNALNQLINRSIMKNTTNQVPFWNCLKTSAKTLAALALFGVASTVAQAQVTYTPFFTKVWEVLPGANNEMKSTGNNTRGIAINPLTTNVLFASTESSNHVGVISASSGSNFLGGLSASGVSGGGGKAICQVRVADDGAVYACNLVTAGTGFKLYRWASDSDFATAPATVANSPTLPPMRLGDYMDIRGSGINTEIVVVGNGAINTAGVSTNFVIFRPTDASCTTFTNFSITIPGGSASINVCGGGVAFEGTNNAIWVRRSGSQETRRVVYAPTTLTATVPRTNNVDQSVCTGLKYYKGTNGVELLATVQISNPRLARVFNISTSPNSGTLVSVLSSNMVTGNTDVNGQGYADVQNGNLVFYSQNNSAFLFQVGFLTQTPPSSLTIGSSAGTVVAGYGLNVTLTGTASGTAPLKYQWVFTNSTTTNILVSNTTNNTYTVSNIVSANAGGYYFVVTNSFGSVTSGVTSLTVLPNGGSSFASPLWSLAPDSRPYLTGAGTDTQRGLAYDANSNRVVVVSRVSHTNLNDLVTVEPYGAILLDANTGAEVGELDMSTLWSTTPVGTFPVSMVGVADDGVVYVANLITSANSDTFAIYSWPAADGLVGMNGTPAYYSNPMGVAYPGAGGLGRIGDSMAVRGAGTNTQILCPFRNGTNICIFTTANGFNFDAHVIAVTNLSQSAELTDPFAGASPLALGCAFGSGNTFWAKSSIYNLRQVSFNLDDNTAAVIGSHAVNGTSAPLGVNNVGGYIGIIGHNELPMNLALYDINKTANLTTAGVSDRELFGLGTNSVPNGNGTGAVGFDTKRARAFALSSNNGILAVQINPATGAITAVPAGGTVTWVGPGILQSATIVNGPYADVVGAISPYTNTGASQLFFRIKR